MGKKPTTSASGLPERLRYLQPFRRRFASCAPEDLNEDSGAPPSMALLSKRIRGLSVEEAAHVLEQDHAALDQWLSSLGEEIGLLFVLGAAYHALQDESATRSLIWAGVFGAVGFANNVIAQLTFIRPPQRKLGWLPT